MKIIFKDGVVFNSSKQDRKLAFKDILNQLYNSAWIKENNDRVYKKMMAKRAKLITGETMRIDKIEYFFQDLEKADLISIEE